MESKFIKITDKNEWQNLLDKVLFKTFFHNIGWEEFLEKQFQWLRFERYLYKDSALISLAKVGNKLISHPFCEYGGPLPLQDKIDGRQFKQDLSSEFDKAFLKINLHPYLLNYFDDLAAEISGAWRKTYFIKRLPITAFRYDIRHAIKKAEGRGFRLEECRQDQDLENFYRLYLKTVRRHKNIPLPFPFFRFFRDNAKVFLLKLDDKIATGSIFLPNRPFLHYFITAGNPDFRNDGANHLLLWQVIEKYLGRDYDIMDLGATREGSDLEVFKRGWRGEARPIYEISTGDSQKEFRSSKLRNVLGLTPSFLMRKISPYLLKYKL